MARCSKHPEWKLPEGCTECPDCLWHKAGSHSENNGPLALEWADNALNAALLTMTIPDSRWHRRHIRAIERNFGIYSAIAEARRFQGEPETGRSWPPKSIPIYEVTP